MPIANPTETLQRAQRYLESSPIQNLRSQAHARAILRSVAREPEGWPHFRPDLDARLHHAAHSLLWSALQLMEAGHPQAEVNPLLLAGSEAFEFLCSDPRQASPVRLEQAVTATFGYYLGGYYARSFVLLRDAVPEGTPLPPALALLVAVLRKRFDLAREITLANFNDPQLGDDEIAGGLDSGTLGEDEAYDRILLASATQAVSQFLEYPKTGNRELLESAIAVLDDAVLIAQERRYVDWWWWLFCLRFLFRELGQASPWERLRPLRGSDGWVLVEEFIRAGLRSRPPVVELWPSQVHALPTILAAERPSFCLKMPTSAGKTRIAELTILRFLLDHATDGEAKCIYLAPFRSLAVEVEQTLRRSLGTLGVLVSQIYGGFEATPADAVFLNQYRILIATPEKFDALLRFVPELAGQIRLVVIDEGHIIDATARGLRFEFFVHRLVRRLRGPHCRFVFISAVLPNAAQFSEWITGTPDNLVESEWRPSRLMLGRLGWDGSRVRIDYTHRGRSSFGQDCFVPKFVAQRPCLRVPGLGKRRNPYPANEVEAFAAAALLFAKEGTTLVFVPQQQHAESTARHLLDALLIQRALAAQNGEDFSLPTVGRDTATWSRCRLIIESEMGNDSLLLRLLDEGIIVHHGDLPARARIAVEELARTEAVRLIVATTTLAQGVNFPIKTVLVRGLHLGRERTVSPMTFWNICGRAGRGMKENEGQVLFCVDSTKPRHQLRRQNALINSVIDTLQQATVASGMLVALRAIAEEWRATHPGVDISELCLHLAEDKFDWVRLGEQDRIRNMVDILDGHLLALSEEFELDPVTPDRLEEILQGSLLFIQLRQPEATDLTPERARSIFHSRVGMIHRRHPDRSVRRRLYLLGMTLSACQQIEDAKAALFDLFCEAESWASWSHEQRADLLLRIASFVFSVHDTSPDAGLPTEWPAIFTLWLRGMTTSEMVTDPAVASFTTSPSELSLLIEDLCGYRLPWGLNSILVLLQSLQEELGRTLPSVCSYFAGMVKAGLYDPVAVCLLPYLDQERSLALRVSPYCPHSYERPEDIAKWIVSVTPEWLVTAGLDPAVASEIVRARRWHSGRDRTERTQQATQFDVPVIPEAQDAVEVGQKVLVVPDGDTVGTYQVRTLQGVLLSRFRHDEADTPWWRDAHLVDSEVMSLGQAESGEPKLTVNLRES